MPLRAAVVPRLLAALVALGSGCGGSTAAHLQRGRLERACAVAEVAPDADRARLARALRTDGLRVAVRALTDDDLQRLLGFVPEPVGRRRLLLVTRLERAGGTAGETEVIASLTARPDTSGDTSVHVDSLRQAFGLPPLPPPPSSREDPRPSRFGALVGFARVFRGLAADVVLLGTGGVINLNASNCRDSPGTTCVLGTLAGAARNTYGRAPATRGAPPPPPSGPPRPTPQQKAAAVAQLEPMLRWTCSFDGRGSCETLQVLELTDRPEDGPLRLELRLEHRAFIGCRVRERLLFALPPGARVAERINALTPAEPRPLSALRHTQLPR